MKKEKMIQHMELLDEQYIAEAAPDNAENIRRHRSGTSLLLKYSVIAASFVLAAGVLLALPHLHHDNPLLSDETDNTNESTALIEETTDRGTESVENTEPTKCIDIPTFTPMTAEWDVFEILGKPAQFILLTDEQAEAIAYETDPLLYQRNEEGVWMFWTILSDGWTMREIFDIYNITSEQSILQIDTTEKNTKAKGKTHSTEQEVIGNFYEILQKAEVMHLIAWCEHHGLQEKSENDIDTVLYVDILTENDDVFSLQLYQHTDCLVQNGETFYQLKNGDGEKLFYLLKGITVNEFKESLKEAENESSAPTQVPGYLEIPAITLAQSETLLYHEDEAVFRASPVGGNPTIFFFDDSLTFWFRQYLSVDLDAEYYTGTLTLPDGFSDGRVVYVTRGGGSGEIAVYIEAIHNGQKEYLLYGFYFLETPSGVYEMDELQIKRLILMEALAENEAVTD